MPSLENNPARFVLFVACFGLLLWIAEVAGAWLAFLSCFGLVFGGGHIVNGTAGWVSWLVGIVSLLVLMMYFVVLPLSRRTDWYKRLKKKAPL